MDRKYRILVNTFGLTVLAVAAWWFSASDRSPPPISDRSGYAGAAVGAYTDVNPDGPPREVAGIQDTDVAETTIVLHWFDEEKRAPQSRTVRTSNPALTANLLAALKGARPSPECKCAPVGQLSLRLKSDRIAKLDLVPGHGPQTYDYRFEQHRFQIPRDPFVKAMSTLDISPKELGLELGQ